MASNQSNITGYIASPASDIKECMAEIVFGTPSKNCEGVGICRMIGPNFQVGKAIICPHVPGYLTLDAGRNILSVRFPKKHLSIEMVARHFCKRLFKVTESYRVPVYISRMLGIAQSIQILEGQYAVRETMHDWIVVFGARGWKTL